MKIVQKFKKVGNDVVQKFKSKPIINIFEANERIAELEAKVEAKETSPMFINTPDTKTETKRDIIKEGQAMLEEMRKSREQRTATIENQKLLEQNKAEADAKRWEVERQALISTVKSNRKYADKISMADYNSPEKLKSAMALIDAEEKYKNTTAYSWNSPVAIAKLTRAAYFQEDKISKSVVHRMANQGYEVAYDNGRAFARRDPSNGRVHPWVALSHGTGGSPAIVSGMTDGKDLTASEYADIVASKPSYENLVKAYTQCQHDNRGLKFNSDVVNVW